MSLSGPAKQLLLGSLLANDGIISKNGKCFLKELVLRRDPRLGELMDEFDELEEGDASFIEKIHNLIKEESKALYEELFSETSLEVGKKLSKEERDRKQLDEKSLIYGEVDFDSFYKVLRKINSPSGGVFYDLGSGTAKAVLAARFTRDFKKCIGFEILSGLHHQALKVINRCYSEFNKYLWAGQDQHSAVYEGSFLDFNWSNGDVVFANSTCFDDELMKDMSKQAEDLKPGAIFVTFTKGLTSRKFEVLERKRYTMSWGPATVFIHRKLNDDGSPVGKPNLLILPSDSIELDRDESSGGGGGGGDYDDYDDDDDNDSDSDSDSDISPSPYISQAQEAFGLDTDDTAWTRPDLADLSPSRWASADDSMNGLNSPQDSALLKRKHQSASRWSGQAI